MADGMEVASGLLPDDTLVLALAWAYTGRLPMEEKKVSIALADD
jgi:hypothetical protein